MDYESTALSAELRARIFVLRIRLAKFRFTRFRFRIAKRSSRLEYSTAQRLTAAADQDGAERAALRRAGVRGIWRRRAPVASKMALPRAAATRVIAVSPAPVAGALGRSMRTISIWGRAMPRGKVG